MSNRRTLVYLIFACLALLALSACDVSLLPKLEPTPEPVEIAETEVQMVVGTEPLLEALTEFRLTVPNDPTPGYPVFLSVLDEVTGLYLNAQNFPMDYDPIQSTYNIQLPFALGSVVKYRYERQAEELRVAEHSSEGSPVRYRLLSVDGPGGVQDVVSRWTDSEYTSPSGRIMGQATDAMTGQPIPNLLIAVGGAQTYTTADGSFLIEGLPPGVHNLVGYALDGSYRVFQQGAEIAPDATTPTPISLFPAPLVEMTFRVIPPAGTPPLVPLRLAGNLYQLGNTFGTLQGGVNTLATRMPVLQYQPDGSYAVTLQLPAGTDIRYKYTLGDGFWNAERNPDGSLKLRQLIVPEQEESIEDVVDTWQTQSEEFITFDLTVPENTPPGDYVSIQLNPLFGWTEPVPMWSLGGNRWAYVLYGPLNLPGNLSYRYCRNNQCGVLDDIATPGLYGPGRTVNLEQLPIQFKEYVQAWVGLDQPMDPLTVQDPLANPRPEGFLSGIEFQPAYHPSLGPLTPSALTRLQSNGADWLVLDPTWSVTRANPPVFEPVAGQDALWPDLIATIESAHSLGVKVAVQPTPNFQGLPEVICEIEPCPGVIDRWWVEGQRDFSYWLVWFDHYRDFILHHADLAEQTGAEMLVLGGDWLNPALPLGILYDGTFSQVPSDTEQRWRSLLEEVRQHYSGQIAWSFPYVDGQIVPAFLDAVDQIIVAWSPLPLSTETIRPTQNEMVEQYSALIDSDLQPLQSGTNKPLILALDASSNPDLTYQLDVYQSLLEVINQRPWISGFISRGFYLPGQIQDQTSSVNGKTAEIALQKWFSAFSP